MEIVVSYAIVFDLALKFPTATTRKEFFTIKLIKASLNIIHKVLKIVLRLASRSTKLQSLLPILSFKTFGFTQTLNAYTLIVGRMVRSY